MTAKRLPILDGSDYTAGKQRGRYYNILPRYDIIRIYIYNIYVIIFPKLNLFGFSVDMVIVWLSLTTVFRWLKYFLTLPMSFLYRCPSRF